MKNRIKVDVIFKPDCKTVRKLKREIAVCRLGLALAFGGLYFLYRKMEAKNENDI